MKRLALAAALLAIVSACSKSDKPAADSGMAAAPAMAPAGAPAMAPAMAPMDSAGMAKMMDSLKADSVAKAAAAKKKGG